MRTLDFGFFRPTPSDRDELEVDRFGVLEPFRLTDDVFAVLAVGGFFFFFLATPRFLSVAVDVSPALTRFLVDFFTGTCFFLAALFFLIVGVFLLDFAVRVVAVTCFLDAERLGFSPGLMTDS